MATRELKIWVGSAPGLTPGSRGGYHLTRVSRFKNVDAKTPYRLTHIFATRVSSAPCFNRKEKGKMNLCVSYTHDHITVIIKLTSPSMATTPNLS